MQRRRSQSVQRARTRSARRSAKRSRMGGKRARGRGRRGGGCSPEAVDPNLPSDTDPTCTNWDRYAPKDDI